MNANKNNWSKNTYIGLCNGSGAQKTFWAGGRPFFLKKSPFLLFFFLIFLDLFGLFSLSCSRLIGFPVKSTVTNLSASWSVSGLFNICVDNIFFLDDYVISFPVFYHLQILQCTHNIVSINCPFITERLKWNEGGFFFIYKKIDNSVAHLPSWIISIWENIYHYTF